MRSGFGKRDMRNTRVRRNLNGDDKYARQAVCEASKGWFGDEENEADPKLAVR